MGKPYLNLGLFAVLISGRHNICEIHCLALDGFDLKTVHKLSSKDKKLWVELGFEPGAAGWEARIMLPLCYAATQLKT